MYRMERMGVTVVPGGSEGWKRATERLLPIIGVALGGGDEPLGTDVRSDIAARTRAFTMLTVGKEVAA